MNSKDSRPMRTVVYTRVSSEEQIQNYSLDSQEKACREYCKEKGWEVVKVFREEGESAKTANRTQLNNLLEYCHKNKKTVDVVLVAKFDRFARDSAVHHSVKAFLASLGISVKSVNEHTDDSPAGRFMENIFAATAQWDNDVRSERSKNGLKEKVFQGNWAWGAPLGYRNTPSGLKIDPEKGPLVRKMFEVYAQGNDTIKSLTTKVNRWGLRNKTDKKLYAQTVTKMLQNKLYMGVIQVPRWNYEGESLEPILVTPETFRKCESVRNHKVLTTAPRLIKNPDFPLKSVIYCDHCKTYLTGSYSSGRSSKYPYYHCAKCGKTRIKKADLEYSFLQTLRQIQPNPEIQQLFKEILIDVNKQKLSNKTKSLERIDKNISNLRQKKAFILDQNFKRIIDDVTCKENTKELTQQINELEIDRSELREQETSIDHLLAVAENILSNVGLLWFEAAFEQKLRFQSLVFPNGVYYEDGNIGTTTLGLPFALIQDTNLEKTTLVHPRGLKPAFSLFIF